MIYENRAVLFLDLLGFSELVKSRERVGRLLAILQHVQGRALEVQEQGKMEFTAFSDCVVVSAPLNDGKGALRIVRYAQFLALDLLAQGFLTRGAIVVGDLYHEGKIVLGPALVDAYMLESKKAQYPRILVTPEIRQFTWGTRDQFVAPSLNPHANYFREDFDGTFHVDLFAEDANSPEAYWGTVGDNGAISRTAFRDACLIYLERVYAQPIPAVAEQKYAWLARYYFEKCQCNLWPVPANLPIDSSKRDQYERELRDMNTDDPIE